MAGPKKLTIDQYIKMLRTLEKKGTAGLNKFANLLWLGAGAAAGAGVAPVVAGLAGANAIPVLSYLGSLVGVGVVAGTPVGWVIGCGVAGAGIAGGLRYLSKKGWEHNHKQQVFKEEIIEKIRNYKTQFVQMPEEEQFKKVIHILILAHYNKETISPENGRYIITQLGNKQINALTALNMCEDLINK